MDVERLFNRHKDLVYRQMVRVCGNHEDAEDALGEALYAAVKAAEQLRDVSNFQAWLARIGTRACYRTRVREKLIRLSSISALETRGIHIPDGRLSPAAEAESGAVKACVAHALNSLSSTYKDVYFRREILGEKAEDVAEQLGISIAAVKSRLHRAREIVRNSLDKRLDCVDVSG